MRNRFLTVLASMLSALTACATLNHSPEDTYRYVRSRLGWQIRYGRMELQAAFDGTDVTEPAPNGWEGFLGTKMSNGWTFEEKKEASTGILPISPQTTAADSHCMNRLLYM